MLLQPFREKRAREHVLKLLALEEEERVPVAPHEAQITEDYEASDASSDSHSKQLRVHLSPE